MNIFKRLQIRLSRLKWVKHNKCFIARDGKAIFVVIEYQGGWAWTLHYHKGFMYLEPLSSSQNIHPTADTAKSNAQWYWREVLKCLNQ